MTPRPPRRTTPPSPPVPTVRVAMADKQGPGKKRKGPSSAYLAEVERQAAESLRKEAEVDAHWEREGRRAKLKGILALLGLALVGIAAGVAAVLFAPRGWPVAAGLAAGAALVLAGAMGLVFIGLVETGAFEDRRGRAAVARLGNALRMAGAGVAALILGAGFTA